MCKRFLLCLAAFFLFLSWGRCASAHTTPVSYEPEVSSVVQEMPQRVRIRFSERIDSAASSINVRAPNGMEADDGNAETDAHDTHVYQIGLKQPGADGTYTVVWQAVSADDGHFAQGVYVFSVGKVTPGSEGSLSRMQVQRITTIPQAAAIALELYGQAILLGFLFVLWCVWKPAEKYFHRTISREHIAYAERLLTQVALFGVGLVIVGVVSILVLKTLDLEQLRKTSFFPTFLVFVRTLDGVHAVGRAALAVLFGAIFFAGRKKIFSYPRVSFAEALLLCAAVLIIVSRARVSHSAATSFFPGVSVGITALHLFAKDLWIGGLIAMAAVFFPLFRRVKNHLFACFSLTSFSMLVSAAFGIGGVTGVYIVWLDLKNPAYLFTSKWGETFIILLMLAGFFLATRLFYSLFMEERLVTLARTKAGETGRHAAAWLGRVFAIETILGIALLFVTSILIITSPPYYLESRSFGFFELSLVGIACAIGACAIWLFCRNMKSRARCLSFAEEGLARQEPTIPLPMAPSFLVVYGVLFHIFAFIWITSWFLKTDFQKTCERNGNSWTESVPMRDGIALSDETVAGCTVGVGLYHFADEREYVYFTHPR